MSMIGLAWNLIPFLARFSSPPLERVAEELCHFGFARSLGALRTFAILSRDASFVGMTRLMLDALCGVHDDERLHA
jgi:hypothetical protein